MGERKGQNKYYPPDFDYRKHKSLDAYHGSHPLRERANKLHLGILIIRFEMPYNIWCDGCGNHIGMGVRYNAEKSKIGNYYSTPIYKFRMKCHLCPNYFEIKTDPAAHDYVIISGARRKEQRWDPKENGQIVTDDKAMQKKLVTDAMFRLEHSAEDQAKLKMTKPGIGQLSEIRESMKDDYHINRLARDKFRSEKKMLKMEEDMDNALLKKSSLAITLVDERSEDVRFAKLMKYRTVASFDEKLKKKREEIEGRPIFAASTSHGSPTDQRPDQSKSKIHKFSSLLGIDQRKSGLFGKSKPNFGTSNSKGKSGSLPGVKVNGNKNVQLAEQGVASPEHSIVGNTTPNRCLEIRDESENDDCQPSEKASKELQEQKSDDENNGNNHEENDIKKPNALSSLSLNYDSDTSTGDDSPNTT